jgi:CRP-like cAMP-binding protein
MIEAHLAKLRKRDDISAEEEQAVRALVADVQDVPADKVFIKQDKPLEVSTLLLDGIVCRYKDLKDGRRQIAQLHVAGDFVDLHSFTLKRLDHNLLTLTDCRIGLVPHERLRDMTERFPHLTRVYWLMSNIDAAMSREWELSLGRRDAAAKVAHLFCEMYIRLGVVGLCDGNTCPFPLIQTEIAECVGLTPVHVNRTLQEMRRQGLVELKAKRLVIPDFQRLKDVAEFNPNYLYLEKRPR